jgi:succinate dehydrogenase hydrophobic anchor subunit
MAILGLAMLHGMNGVRQIAWDYIGNNKTAYTVFMGIVVLLSVIVTILGTLALIFGATAK